MTTASTPDPTIPALRSYWMLHPGGRVRVKRVEGRPGLQLCAGENQGVNDVEGLGGGVCCGGR